MIAALGAFTISCTGTDGLLGGFLDVPFGSVDVADVEAELPGVAADLPDVVPQEVTADELVFDVHSEDTGALCEPGEGCFLDPCEENESCLSGWCVGHMGEDVCTIECQTECPQGWSCEQIPGTAPDVVWICVSRHANLCLPCATGADCKGAAGADDVCVDYAMEGSFCGGTCEADEDCPWGFSCTDTQTVDGIATKQCVAEAGVCPCTEKSVSLALWTPCEMENEWGVCAGKRVCTEAGLAECDALVPAEETCNGLDDDCDGDVDEPNDQRGQYISLCDDGNECTEDSCVGEEGCEHVALDMTECKDGDICTVADHCVAGVCVGDPVICDDENPCTDNLCAANGGCDYPPNQDPCDDGNPCTVADECLDSECVGVEIPCDCQKDEDCGLLEDGNLCNGTLECAMETLPHKCVVKAGTVVECPAPEGIDSPCLAAWCDPASGQCSMVAHGEGAACNDLDLCSLADFCADGQCAAGKVANCNDGNPCTDDSCEAQTGCIHEPNESPCSDGDVCSTGDVCVEGECISGELQNCDDGNPCTDDSCDPAIGCVHLANAALCDDGNLCTTGDHCGAGKCVFDGYQDCDDENVCTKDLCVPADGCVYQPVAGPCTDNNACTDLDVCKGGECIPGDLLDCDDDNVCTKEQCSPQQGCLYQTIDGICDDVDECTVGDVCGNGVCVPGAPADCDDANLCTDDSCDPDTGCLSVANSDPCDDNDPCTMGDLCVAGACVPGQQLDCNDGNPCTDDSCEEGIGCVHAWNQAPCDDGNLCTEGDMCVGGICKAGAAKNCADDDVCTDDTCSPVLGCTHQLNEAPCNDGNLCTTNDHCHLGSCIGGGDLNCDDGSVCTDDSCDPDGGCVFQQIVFPCCPPGLEPCGDVCINDQIDPDNCGECGKECGAGEICVAGFCQTDCPPGLIKCGDLCTSLQFDPANCNECGHACQAGDNAAAVCAAGVCASVCLEGFGDCNQVPDDGCEADLGSSKLHCGECGEVCVGGANTEAFCEAGECSVICLEGYDDCNNNMGDGCEINLNTSLAHCGECGQSCEPGVHMNVACNDGECSQSCENNWGDCDENAAGCETNLLTTKLHCGECDHDCGALNCAGGQCYSCDPATEVFWNGKCYYLDGSKGQCDAGYVLAPQSALYTIRTWFAGKNYKHTISNNCCIYNAEADEDFGMADHCNTNGPFTANDVSPGAAGCTNQTNFNAGQLTFCMTQ